jgi:aryl-alcohol dehydrogenase-like predicted oxidoreductase
MANMTKTMQKRKLGALEVSTLGLGCMGMSAFYDRSGVTEKESIALIHKAIDLGVNFFDTAEIYGPYTNEELVGKALRGKRDQVVIATKFAFRLENGERIGLDGSAKNVKAAAEGSLKRLNVEVIDLFYQHRVDRNVPIEETVGAMAELVKEGKVRYLGLSEAGAERIRGAHAVHPITAVQSEYSLWERKLEESVIPTLNELGIGLVPYSPLGRGFLTGHFDAKAQLKEGDIRHNDPRFQEENIEANLNVVEAVRSIAREHGATPAQIALAWCLSRGANVVPIPGTTKVDRLIENCGSVDVVLSAADHATIDQALAHKAGERYTPAYMSFIEN